MNASAAVRPVITGWSAVSPYGLDAGALAEGLRSGRPTATALDTTRWQVPEGSAHLVPDFEVREILGKKGTRSMDRVTGLAVSAVRGLLGQPDADPQRETGDRAALVLGTTTGSVASMMDFTRSSLEGARPFDVDPALMPNAVMNCAAGQAAIWHGLRGPNVTLAGGRTASLAAVSYATRLLASGRADSVLCGAVEEFSAARYWIEHHSREPEAPETGIGEGCAMLLIQPSDAVSPERHALAEVLAVRSRVAARVDDRELLAACVRSALDAAGVAPDEVWAAVPGEAPGTAGRTEVAALRAALGERAEEALTRVPAVSVLGDVTAASGAFQIAILLSAAAADQRAAAGRPVVLTSVDRDGALACAVLRLGAA
ncbi:beta-ketoacyl synthase N-terminal-like domain-containing protein [Kitasatospora sp. NPDC101183]|uniref:beta-ketoacyl synthase N-terminal-like domain-containing protein n=1 Tax=Kitasatospora sp. NPDC101183 TaxID=3364100 RepID=UPI00382F6182